MKKLVIILLLLQGCSSFEGLQILPGLCYNDRDGTHLCPCDKDHRLNCIIEDVVEDKVRIEIDEWFKE
jgi:hypothetical protein